MTAQTYPQSGKTRQLLYPFLALGLLFSTTLLATAAVENQSTLNKTGNSKAAKVTAFADQLSSHYFANKPLPHFSALYPTASLADAYKVQKRFVATLLKADQIAGYKAGLTAKAGQQKFKVDRPLAGVLLEKGRLSSRLAIELNDYRKLMLETEIGFVLNTSIKVRVASVAELKTKVKAVMPAIELPDLGYQNIKQLNGPDLVASNVAARAFVVGDSRPNKSGLALNQVQVRLYFNHKLISEGKGSDALNDQWQALLWLVNQLVEMGYQPAANQFLITGTLGKLSPALPGHYLADYGEFGKIEFDVTQ